MTTQNIAQHRCVFAAGVVGAGTYYGPFQLGAGVVGNLGFSATAGNAYVDMNGYDHLSIMGTVTAVGAATCTLTIWSSDGVSGFLWNETLGCYDSVTNAYAATYVGTGGIVTPFHLHLDGCNGRLFHVRLVTTDNTAAAVLTFRQTKV